MQRFSKKPIITKQTKNIEKLKNILQTENVENLEIGHSTTGDSGGGSATYYHKYSEVRDVQWDGRTKTLRII